MLPLNPGALMSATRIAADVGTSARWKSPPFGLMIPPLVVLPCAMYSRPSGPNARPFASCPEFDTGRPVMMSVRVA